MSYFKPECVGSRTPSPKCKFCNSAYIDQAFAVLNLPPELRKSEEEYPDEYLNGSVTDYLTSNGMTEPQLSEEYRRVYKGDACPRCARSLSEYYKPSVKEVILYHLSYSPEKYAEFNRILERG